MSLDDSTRWAEFDKIDEEPDTVGWINLNKFWEYHPDFFPLPLSFAGTLDPVKLQYGKTFRGEFLFAKSYDNIDDRLRVPDNKIDKEDLGRLLFTSDKFNRKCALLKIGDKLWLEKLKNSGHWTLARRTPKEKE